MQQTTKSEWVEPFTNALGASLKMSAAIAYDNACNLLTDAVILKAANRFSRASALAVLAVEEFSKAFIVCIAVKQPRWDSNLHKGLRDHAPKQAVAQSMLIYWEWAKDHHGNVDAGSLVAPCEYTPTYLPSDMQMSKMLKEVHRSHMKTRKRDQQKQDYLYVGIDRRGKVTNDPSSTSLGSAEFEIEQAMVFKKIAENLLAHTIGSDFTPKP